jgi:SAM-dependent methyltransferase
LEQPKEVVGFFWISTKPNGEIGANGASFDWENGQLVHESKVGFESIHVGSTENEEPPEGTTTTSHILYHLNEVDLHKRRYTQGLLQFKFKKGWNAVIEIGGTDVYAGYLQSTDKSNESVHSLGYAERLCRGIMKESDIKNRLEENGSGLFAKLDQLLRTETSHIKKNMNTMSALHANFWGHQIPSPQSVILSPRLRPHIDRLLGKVLALIGMDAEASEKFTRLAAESAKKEKNILAYERRLKDALAGQTKGDNMDAAMIHRAKVVYKEIEPYLCGESLLDIGCGNGLISNLAKDRFKRIQLLDVVNYLDPTVKLQFTLYTEGHKLPVHGLFDTVLVLTVLHHSNKPVELLKMAWAVTKRRLIIIESVVGVHQAAQAPNYELVDSTEEDQIAYAAFVDWFYNRVLHDDVPVPYNFTTPKIWQKTFMDHNMPLAQTILFGQDIDIGPEFHVLFVLEK